MRALSVLLPLTLCLVYSSPSLAFEGRYRAGGGGYNQELTIKKRSAGSYDVVLVVGTEGCSGYFEGIGAIKGAELAATSPPPADPDDKCVIDVSRHGAALDVTESGCVSFHGASCEFTGRYKKRR
jgi:hypothetical protein